jgi:ABC-type hemin transport system ATPase subunit
MRARKLARMLGVLAQNHRVGYGFSVEEVVRWAAMRTGDMCLQPVTPRARKWWSMR